MTDRLFSLEQQLSQLRQQSDQGWSIAHDWDNDSTNNRLLALEQSLNIAELEQQSSTYANAYWLTRGNRGRPSSSHRHNQRQDDQEQENKSTEEEEDNDVVVIVKTKKDKKKNKDKNENDDSSSGSQNHQTARIGNTAHLMPSPLMPGGLEGRFPMF